MFAKQKDYEQFGTVVAALPELAQKMEKELETAGMTKVFTQIEMPLIPVLYKMEVEGIDLDTGSLEDFSGTLKTRIDELTKKIITLAEALELYDQKFKALAQNKVHIMKSVAYFADAENDELPRMAEPVRWTEVKKFFEREQLKIAKKVLRTEGDGKDAAM